MRSTMRQRGLPDALRAALAAGVVCALALVPGVSAATAQSPEPSGAAPSPLPSSAQPSPAPQSPAAGPSTDDGALPLPAVPQPGDPVELAAGRYGSSSLGHRITFEVGEGWSLLLPELPNIGWALLYRDDTNAGLLSFAPFEGTVFQDPCGAQTDEVLLLEPRAEELVKDIAVNPSLIAARPVPTELAGFSGFQLDVATQQPMGCEPPVTFLWSLPDGVFQLESGEEARFIALDVGDRVVVLAVETYPGADFEAFLEEASGVIETVTIVPGERPVTSPAPGSSGAPSASPPPLVAPNA